jgi:putative membrane protein
MRRDLIATAAGLSATLLLIIGASAAQAPTTQDFVKTVAISDMFEVQSGQLASEKAENDEVQSFGKQMVDDHTKTTDELKDLVGDENLKVALPPKLDEQHQTKLDKLKGLSGSAFDKEYVRIQIDAHENAVALFEAYASAGENDKLKAWAKNTLPTLTGHLEHAQKLKSSVEQTAQADTKKSAQMTANDTAQDDDNVAADAANKAASKSNIKYITRQTPTDWTAEALIGRTVENAQGDDLGEINNVIINEKGNVVAVVIGVGGFLGIGEKNVGVPFDALKFRAVDPAEKRGEKARDEQTDATEARFDSEHEDMHIVLNTSKEDLEAAPTFAWLNDQGSSMEGEHVVR